MNLTKFTLLFGLILTLLSDPILGKTSLSGSHSYPKSSGLSSGHHSSSLSGGSHSYPKSSGLSGGGHHSSSLSGGSHGYPSSGGSHAYPSSGSSHTYPSSGGGKSYPSSGGSHTYPSSGGSSYPSSGGSHTYPSSGGSHTYPSSGGSNTYPSSGGSHTYPSSGGSHTYPSSGGSSYPSSGGSHTYPSSGAGKTYYPSSASYPTPGKNSGTLPGKNTHSYPSSGSGSNLSGGGSGGGSNLSGGNRGYPSNTHVKHTTTVHHHYHYAPPSQIRYIPKGGGAPINYPIYRGEPPTYVYQYKNSGTKYGSLLAGLALMNLGTLGVASYAVHKSNQNPGSQYNYVTQPGEICKFGVKSPNGEYEETRIGCQIISSFIYEQNNEKQTGSNSTVTTTTTVTNVTIVNNTNVGVNQPMVPPASIPGNVMYSMLPNGTLVPVNVTGVIQPQPGPAGGSSVTVTTTTTNTTQLVNALDVKGKPVEVTPGMQCFVIRVSPTSSFRKPVNCRLLQTYADRSFKPNSAAKNVPIFTFVAAIVAYFVAY